MEKHLGFRLLRASTLELIQGKTVAYGHGDQETRHGLSSWQRFIRSRVIHTLYAEILPGSFAQWLARMWSRGSRSSRLDGKIVRALRKRGEDVLVQNKAEIVVYGHCHAPSHDQIESGSYLNTGSWALHRSFVTLEEGAPALWRWTTDGPREFGQESPEAKLQAV